MFPVENGYSGILPGESYIGIRALADFFCLRLKYPTHVQLRWLYKQGLSTPGEEEKSLSEETIKVWV